MQKKKIIIVLFILLVPFWGYAQKKKQNILSSTDITEIEGYLKTTHPDDPKKIVLKSRLIELKNKEWTKNSHYAKPMPARSLAGESSYSFNEDEEFMKLMNESLLNIKKKQ